MPAVRVRATSGWQDLTLQGAPGRSGGWQEIGYVEATGDVAVSGSSAAPNTILTLPALIFDGATTIELEFWSRSVVPAAAANAYIAWAVWQDGVMLGVNAPFFQSTSGGGAIPAHLKTRIKPSAGSHTYSIRAWQVGGNGTIVGGQSPGCMMFFSAKIVQPQGMGPPLVTTLPSNPIDGQEVYYLADAVNGTVWHLRFRAASSSAYKWEFVGGGTLSHAVDAGEQVSAASTWVNLATNGPLVAVPLAGDYDYTFAFAIWGGANNLVSQAGVVIGDTTPTSPMGNVVAPLANYASTCSTSGKITAPSAGSVIKMRYYSFQQTNIIQHRRLFVTPVRVG